MATLSTCPTANFAVRNTKTTIAASAAANSNRSIQGKKTTDILQGALMMTDAKSPWWAPLFRFGRDLDYSPEDNNQGQTFGGEGSSGCNSRKEKRALFRSGLTEEKARVLRKEMRAMDSWRDVMYHSAIATRLALPDQS